CLFDASYRVVNRNTRLPFQPIRGVLCHLSVQVLLALRHHRLQTIDIGSDFRFKGIPVRSCGILRRFNFLIDLFCWLFLRQQALVPCAPLSYLALPSELQMPHLRPSWREPRGQRVVEKEAQPYLPPLLKAASPSKASRCYACANRW